MLSDEPWAALLQSANQIQKIFERQIGMQSANEMKFRGARANALFGALPDFIQRVGVCAGRIGIAAESAEPAMRHANIRGIDVAIDVVIANVAMLFFANKIRQPANGEEIGRAIESDAIGHVETRAGENFFGDWPEMRIGNVRNAWHGDLYIFALWATQMAAPKKQRTTH